MRLPTPVRRAWATITKALLTPVADGRGAWYPLVREPYTGAWQKGDEWTRDTVLAHHAVFTCITLIASDIGKLRPKLVQKGQDGIWSEVVMPEFSALLQKPNRYQNRIQFQEWWITSKLTRGNTYVLKERDTRDRVTALYVLDPGSVKPLIAPDGEVFYELKASDLNGVAEDAVAVPASEVIHDRINCLFHPLIGVSPIFASGSAANIGLKIQNNSANFFGAGSNPSGILTAPGTISQETAAELSDRWNKGYSGANSGKVAVLGNGLSFEPIRMTAVDSQMIEHLKWSAETVAATFHVPAFKVGLGTMPTYQNGEILNQAYYSDCLQSHIEQMEAALDEGLGLMKYGTLGVELDLDGLLRMDTATQVKALVEGIGGALYTPNEARRRMDLSPLTGGDTVYLQQQNYSLAALDERDRNSPLVAPEPAPPPPTPDDKETAAVAAFIGMRERTLRLRVAA